MKPQTWNKEYFHKCFWGRIFPECIAALTKTEEKTIKIVQEKHGVRSGYENIRATPSNAYGTIPSHAEGTIKAHASGTDISLPRDEDAVVNELFFS